MRAAVAVLVVLATSGWSNPLYDAIASAAAADDTPAANPDAAPAPVPVANPAPCAGALAAWPLDEGTGSSTRDCLGRSPGKLTGAVTWTTGRGGAGHAIAFARGAVAIEDSAALRVGGPPLTPAFSALAWVSAKAPPYARFFVSRSDGTQDAWSFAIRGSGESRARGRRRLAHRAAGA